MKKFLLILSVIFLSAGFAAATEKIPVKIVPAENISTTHDQIQLGDSLVFKVKHDVYFNNKILFKKNSRVLGNVSFLNENGWAYDNAEIQLNQFKLRDAGGKIVEINSDITINGFELLKTKGKRFCQFFNYIGVIFRGKEIDIKTDVDSPEFTIWYIK